MNRFVSLVVLVSCGGPPPPPRRVASPAAVKTAPAEGSCEAKLVKAEARIAELEGKPSDGAPAPSMPCTLEALRAGNPKSVSDVEERYRAARQEFLAELDGLKRAREIAPTLAREPKGLPTLRYARLTFTGPPADCPIEAQGKNLETCRAVASCMSDGLASPETRAEPFEGSWRHALALIGERFTRVGTFRYQPHENPPYSQALDFFTGLLPVDSDYMNDEDDGLEEEVRQALIGVIHDEGRLKGFGTWVAPFALQLVPDSERPRLRELVSNLWFASHTDMAELAATVDDDEDYLRREKKKFEGLFLRRWVHFAKENDASRKHADDMMYVYRFWLVRAASILEMEQAAAWAEELFGRELRAATTLEHRAWYLAELSKIKD